MSELLTWLGITFCISQSAMFSGLNLAVFSLSRLQLEVEAGGGSVAARRVLALREDANFALTTILWGNVAINVLLTLLSDSVMTGVASFLFSTFFITLLGEIAPQAYFSRHALQMANRLAPLLRLYQVLLYPVARPSALLLDRWLGREAITYFRERELKDVLYRHMQASETDLDRAETIGALNFLSIDDLPVSAEGRPLDPASIIRLPSVEGQPVFPAFAESPDDPFLTRVEASGRPWVVITDERDEPLLIMDADGLLRHASYHRTRTDPLAFCHKPIVIRDPAERLGAAIERLRLDPRIRSDESIPYDVILLWTDQPRVITGSDLLGRLLRGVIPRMPAGSGNTSETG